MAFQITPKLNLQVNRPTGKRASPERLAALREATRQPNVRVEPTREELRKVLKHVPTGRSLAASGSAEWPFDRFTMRRIDEGAIRIVDPQVEQAQLKRAEELLLQKTEQPPQSASRVHFGDDV